MGLPVAREFCKVRAMSKFRIFLSLILTFAFFSGLLAKPDQPTNVIYILADDLGKRDLGCYGQKKLKNAQHRSTGRRGNEVFQPLLGQYCMFALPGGTDDGATSRPCALPGKMGTNQPLALDPKMVTLPRIFQNAGYATGAFGKWGLVIPMKKGPQNPMTHGFDHFSGWKSQMIAHTYYPTSMVRDGKEIPLDTGTFIHDLIMEDAFSFIERSVKQKKPFFCYIPTAVPHGCDARTQKLHEKWRKVYPQFDGRIGKYGAGPGEPCPECKNPIAGYAAMMENFDNQIGQLLDLVTKLGVDNNTLILLAVIMAPTVRAGTIPISGFQWPASGNQTDLYEGGINAPSLPGSSQIKAGSKSGHIKAFGMWWQPQVDLTHQPTPKQSDGISFLPTLMGTSQKS